MRIYTIGHSNHSLDKFLSLLSQHSIQVLVDVRSHPTSDYARHFNQSNLSGEALNAGIKYVYMGKELGGRPETSDYYDAKRHVRYDQVAQSPSFLHGIERLQQGLQQFRVAVMCSEEDPSDCHRRLLIGRVLAEMGVEVAHIRGDGVLQSEADLVRLAQPVPERQPQLALFETTSEYKAWRSVKPIPSASPRGERRTSLKR